MSLDHCLMSLCFCLSLSACAFSALCLSLSSLVISGFCALLPSACTSLLVLPICAPVPFACALSHLSLGLSKGGGQGSQTAQGQDGGGGAKY